MANPFEALAEIGVIPVIAIESVDSAVPLADALLEGGLPVAEITFRTSAAAEVIETLCNRRPELLVGAGTVLDPAAVGTAIAAGARFGLSPGFDAEVVVAAAGWPFAPGIMTPSDLAAVARTGIRTAKFFPASAAGGPAMLRSIAAPFAHLGIRFIPTGGITEATMGDWLGMPSVAAIGGTWIAGAEDIREGRWSDVTAKARAAVQAVAALRGAER